MEGPGTKRRNLGFLKPRLYMSERRRTDTIIGQSEEEKGSTLRRSQSDRSEYNQKLKAKMAPHSIPEATPPLDPKEQRECLMRRRLKVIEELVQTEKDHFKDLDLCITQVVQPLREKQIECLDVDGLFSNIESVHQISAKLLSMLEYAIAEEEPEMQMIGEIFLQIKTPLEEVYKIYCYHHDDANNLLETYDKDEEIRQHIRNQTEVLKKIDQEQGKSTLLDMGSLLIKPVQRVMRYPLLLSELYKSTPDLHADRKPVEEALVAVMQINTNINEFKRRKDLVMKYKRSDEDETLRDKLSKVNIRSIRKKSNRVTSHLKILTGGEPQVKDEIFDREEKMFRNLEKAVRLCVKNTSSYLHYIQVSPARKVQDNQKRVIEEMYKLSFGKEFGSGSQRVMERRNSSEERSKKRSSTYVPMAPHQTQDQRTKLLSTYRPDKLYQAKRKFNATQDLDASLHEGEIVAVLEKEDPMGSVSRWFVDTGVTQGYVYSSFLRPYHPVVRQNVQSTEGSTTEVDFDDITLFVSSYSEDLNVKRFSHSSDSDTTMNSSQDTSPRGPVTSSFSGSEENTSNQEEQQIFYAVYPFQARSEHELSLQEYERVKIVKSSDLSGNKDWWLAEVNGKRGYVPANYLGKMSYA
ncbi:rho guanine nucleotide exchange factor 38 isoform X3 [Narcine bancroftii]|uniref:rho guanine nucleotide exchange factor 38 isoform X3 n=1 Tax=Narcine bancroftii TaxID=1343680 RepID=UPI003831DA12